MKSINLNSLFSPLETITENVIRLTNAAITEIPFEDFCPVKDNVQNYVQCESCKVSIYFISNNLIS